MADLDRATTGRRLYEPLKCSVLFALAINGESAAEILAALGVSAQELADFQKGYSAEIAEMRRLSMLGKLCTRQMLASLIRARLAEQLMASSKATELAVLTRAASRLPAWIFGEAEPAHAPPVGNARASAAA
jgi:hypothetical protein